MFSIYLVGLGVFAGLKFQELTPWFHGYHGVAIIGSGLPSMATVIIGTRPPLIRSFKPRYRTVLQPMEGQRLVPCICIQNEWHVSVLTFSVLQSNRKARYDFDFSKPIGSHKITSLP